MHKLSLASLIVTTTLSVSSFTTMAAGGLGTITFTGTVVAAPCSVDPVSQTLTVPMGTYNAEDVNAGVSNEVPFSIKLTACDVTTLKNAAVTFNGTASTTPAWLANGDTAGGAIKISDNVGNQIDLGTLSQSTALVTGSNELLFKAQYLKDQVNVTPGLISATATFIITYS
ncbi:MAG: fimbrial protein [Plesiomonas sp.]|uniref:fimbrial protein n=1 Tax=Plesiomonas sp. TaxID=2486279 RepID=UPI003F3371AF